MTTPKGFKEAYEAYAQGGWIGLACDPEYGGQGLPYTLRRGHERILASAANMAFAMYPGLTIGRDRRASTSTATDEQKQHLSAQDDRRANGPAR